MRSVAYFAENELIKKLLRKFEISQGRLYHYTSEEAASGIRGGEFWLTRADCFLDKLEIHYGESLLEQAAIEHLNSIECDSFIRLLSEAKASLNLTYVMSLSQEPENKHLLENYGRFIIEFDETFPMYFVHEGMHSTAIDMTSYRLHFLNTLYDFFEGFVIYDKGKQLEISLAICGAYAQIAGSRYVHKVDAWHFVDIIKRCLILFKKDRYSSESEYRLSITYRQALPNIFEHTRERDNKSFVYVKAKLNRSLLNLL